MSQSITIPNFDIVVSGNNVITLSASLQVLSPDAVAFATEAKEYMASINAGIGAVQQELLSFNEAIISTDDTFEDTEGNERYTWSAIEAYINKDDYGFLVSRVNELGSNTETLEAQYTTHASRLVEHTESINTLMQAASARNQSIDNHSAQLVDLYQSFENALFSINNLRQTTVLNADTLHNHTAQLLSDADELRILNTTYAEHNVWLEQLEVDVDDHERRLDVLENQSLVVDDLVIYRQAHDARLNSLESVMDFQIFSAGLEAQQQQVSDVVTLTDALETNVINMVQAVNDLDTSISNQVNRIDDLETASTQPISASRISQEAVTQHQAALSINSSQISDFSGYATDAELTQVSEALTVGLVNVEQAAISGINALNTRTSTLENKTIYPLSIDIHSSIKNSNDDVIPVDTIFRMMGKSGTVGGQIHFREGTNNGTRAIGIRGPVDAVGNYNLELPGTLPEVNDVLTATAVTGANVTMNWVKPNSSSGWSTLNW